MRVLSLDTAGVEELLNSFGKLKHLRYLDLSNTRIKALPKSIGKFYNLQTLRMQNNWHLNKLPREMQNLINLKKLVLTGCRKCGELPILGHLPFLRDVEIKGMDNLKRIGSEIYGYDLVYEATPEKKMTVLFPALKKLSIEECPELIEWMEAPTTTTTKKAGVPLLGGVDERMELSVIHCPKLASITFSTDLNPCLEKLRIEDCDGLQSLPDFRSFTSLRELCIGGCAGITSLVSEFLQTGLGCLARLEDLRLGPFREDLDSFPDFQVPSQQLVSLELKGWPKLKSLPQQVQHLTSLTSLTIWSFKGVETLPEWLGNLASLVKLSINWKDAPRTAAKNGPRFLTFEISQFGEDLKPCNASVKYCSLVDGHGFHVSRKTCIC
ncbi:hypothetical protein ACLB2K_067839 [Fragaria x ananassa]